MTSQQRGKLLGPSIPSINKNTAAYACLGSIRMLSLMLGKPSLYSGKWLHDCPMCTFYRSMRRSIFRKLTLLSLVASCSQNLYLRSKHPQLFPSRTAPSPMYLTSYIMKAQPDNQRRRTTPPDSNQVSPPLHRLQPPLPHKLTPRKPSLLSTSSPQITCSKHATFLPTQALSFTLNGKSALPNSPLSHRHQQ